jgi:hypothetical protein
MYKVGYWISHIFHVIHASFSHPYCIYIINYKLYMWEFHSRFENFHDHNSRLAWPIELRSKNGKMFSSSGAFHVFEILKSVHFKASYTWYKVLKKCHCCITCNLLRREPISNFQKREMLHSMRTFFHSLTSTRSVQLFSSYDRVKFESALIEKFFVQNFKKS